MLPFQCLSGIVTSSIPSLIRWVQVSRLLESVWSW